MESKFKEDIQKEKIVGEFLDRYFYAEIKDKYQSIKRINDMTLQCKGVDVIFETKAGERIYIDEKACVQYANQDLPTFAFEIMNRTSGRIGWLLNPNYITTDYLLVYPSVEKTEQFKVTEAEIIAIKKQSIFQLLADNEISKDRISRQVKELQEVAKAEHNKFRINQNISINFNFTLREQPVNIVINKRLLKQYASLHTTVYSKKQKAIKAIDKIVSLLKAEQCRAENSNSIIDRCELAFIQSYIDQVLKDKSFYNKYAVKPLALAMGI